MRELAILTLIVVLAVLLFGCAPAGWQCVGRRQTDGGCNAWRCMRDCGERPRVGYWI